MQDRYLTSHKDLLDIPHKEGVGFVLGLWLLVMKDTYTGEGVFEEVALAKKEKNEKKNCWFFHGPGTVFILEGQVNPQVDQCLELYMRRK